MKLIPLPNIPSVTVSPAQAARLAAVAARKGDVALAVSMTRSLKEV